MALVNCIPVFIASDPDFARRFEEQGLPILGDNLKAQLGATITHRALTDLFRKRGVKLERTYQLNTGGNTDFLNMLNRDRLASDILATNSHECRRFVPEIRWSRVASYMPRGKTVPYWKQPHGAQHSLSCEDVEVVARNLRCVAAENELSNESIVASEIRMGSQL